jgi:hypothetical protein
METVKLYTDEDGAGGNKNFLNFVLTRIAAFTLLFISLFFWRGAICT